MNITEAGQITNDPEKKNTAFKNTTTATTTKIRRVIVQQDYFQHLIQSND